MPPDKYLGGSKKPIMHRSLIHVVTTLDRAKLESPGEIKRREVSWTLIKSWISFAGPGEIMRREVVLDPQESPEEIKSREVELGSES